MQVINIQEEGRFAGPHKRMIEVANGLKPYGVETLLLFSEIDAEILRDKLEQSDVDYRLINLHKLTTNISQFLGYWILFISETIKLKNIIKEYKPDIIHVNGSWQWKGIIAGAWCRVPVVWHLSDTFMPWYIKIIFNGFKKWGSRYFIGACKRGIDFYFRSTKDKLIHIIQAPIDTGSFAPSADIDEGKWIGNYHSDYCNIVSVGNITPVKGHDILLRAIKLINEEHPSNKLRFTIVGRIWGTQEKYYNSLLDYVKINKLTNVDFPGGSNNIKEILDSCDMYVCSSRYEASPISVWESMSMALPTVSTDVGDVDVFFKKHDAGIVVPTEDPESLANAIWSLSNNQDMQNKFSKNARKMAIEEFDLSLCVKRHFDCYSDVIRDFETR